MVNMIVENMNGYFVLIILELMEQLQLVMLNFRVCFFIFWISKVGYENVIVKIIEVMKVK